VEIENEEASKSLISFSDLYGRNWTLLPTKQVEENNHIVYSYNLGHLQPALYIATARSRLGFKSHKILILK